MKLIELEVLCKDSVEVESEDNQSYQNVLEELNLVSSTDDTEDETYWKSIYFNIGILAQELFTIEPRLDHEEDNSIFSSLMEEQLL